MLRKQYKLLVANNKDHGMQTLFLNPLGKNHVQYEVIRVQCKRPAGLKYNNSRL